MSDDADDLPTQGKKRISNAVNERLKDGFYGYLLTALALANWQNIFILFKSKKPIEETIKTLTSQPDFIANHFGIPLFMGLGAALLMPWIVVVYVNLVAYARAKIKLAEKQAETVQELHIQKLKLKAQAKAVRTSNLETYIEQKKALHKSLSDDLQRFQDAKSKFDYFFVALNSIHSNVPAIENEEDLKRFFIHLKRSGILENYDGYMLARKLSNGQLSLGEPVPPTQN